MSISGISSGGTDRPDYTQIQQSIFDKADSNGDGSIDSSEFDSMVQNSPRIGNALSSLVTNADGSKATPDQIFKAVDTDGDGKISTAELQGAMKTAHAHGHGHHHGAPPVPAASSSDDSSDSSTTGIPSTISQIFKLLDTNGDGQVSSTELSAAMSSLTAASGAANSSSSPSSSTSSSSDASSSIDATTAATTATSTQTASLQALLQQLMTQIQQQQASYTQNGAATDAGGMPSFFKVSA